MADFMATKFSKEYKGHFPTEYLGKDTSMSIQNFIKESERLQGSGNAEEIENFRKIFGIDPGNSKKFLKKYSDYSHAGIMLMQKQKKAMSTHSIEQAMNHFKDIIPDKDRERLLRLNPLHHL